MCGFRLQPEGCVKRSDEFSAATAFRLKAEATAGSAARGTSHSTLRVARVRTLHRRTWHVTDMRILQLTLQEMRRFVEV